MTFVICGRREKFGYEGEDGDQGSCEQKMGAADILCRGAPKCQVRGCKYVVYKLRCIQARPLHQYDGNHLNHRET